MTMTRRRSAAVVMILVAVGGGGVCVLAQSAATTPEAPLAPSPPTRTDNPYRLSIAGDAMIEVVGVSRWPAGPTTWWRPDGTPLAEPPGAGSGRVLTYLPGGQEDDQSVLSLVGFASSDVAFVVAVRCSARHGMTFRNPVKLEIPNPRGSTTSFARNLDTFSPHLPPAQVPLPAGRERGTLRCVVASGAWTTQATVMARNLSWGIGAVEREIGPIFFVAPRTFGGRANIAVADGVTDAFDTRAVAIARGGALHGARRRSGSASRGVRMQEFEVRCPLG